METKFKLKTTCYDTMINCHLFQKLKLIECKFNRFTIIVIYLTVHSGQLVNMFEKHLWLK